MATRYEQPAVTDDGQTTAAAEQVLRRWRDREAPDGDFVVFADATLVVMELVRIPPSAEWHWRELVRATAWTAVDWVDVDTVHASCAYAGSRALAGESAAHGSIGWVALTLDDDERTLEWLAISGGSNPFAEVTLDETTVTAISTAGHIWTFPRSAPQQVTIVEDPLYASGVRAHARAQQSCPSPGSPTVFSIGAGPSEISKVNEAPMAPAPRAH